MSETTPDAVAGQVERRVMPHTPGPWKLGEFEEHLGYDCMTGGVRAGPAVLDGSDYGQKRCRDIGPEAKARMLADAALIAAAPDLLEALRDMVSDRECLSEATIAFAKAAIAKATAHEA